MCRTKVFGCTWALALMVGVSFAAQPVLAAGPAASCKPRKKKKADEAEAKKAEDAKKGAADEKNEEPKKSEAEEKAAAEAARVEAERVEAARRAAEEEAARKKSIVTPGTRSRWSNKGAMTPVEAEVPITAPLPERNVPVAPGVATPGQGLIGDEELLTARVSFSGYHWQTRGQNFVFNEAERLAGSNNIDFLRGRTMLAYERIGGSEFGVRVDGEYRPALNGNRFTDQRVNELYVSYGLTDFRRKTGLDYGFAVGRVAVREAGYAQADGAAFRILPVAGLKLGAFAGFTGNPFGYNWRLRTSETVSFDWLTGGGFASVQGDRYTVSAAGVLTYGLKLDNGQKGLDRVYAHLDAGYLITDELNVFASGAFDVLPGGSLFQNVEAVVTFNPTPELDLLAGVGRFSTVFYKLQNNSFQFDPQKNTFDDLNVPIVDENGNPIVGFDSALFLAVYNSIRARAGYRVVPEIEIYANANVLLRDTSVTNKVAAAVDGANVQFTSLRALPSLGVRYGDEDVLDASLEGTWVIDKQSNADAFVEARIGRGLYGFYAGLDARFFFGDIGAADGGIDLSYVFPREWFPGALMLNASLHYYRENIALPRPVQGVKDQIQDPSELFVIPLQESYMGFAGIEWRL